MNINIYGSTGVIGKKTLFVLKKYFPHIKINLLCANTKINTLINQIKVFKPRYVYLNDNSQIKKLKSSINGKVKIFNFEELTSYLLSSKSTFSILAVSGYKSLYYLEAIIKNTDNLGIVSKEAIVSAGHIFNKKNYHKKTKIFPIDSEHFSLFEYFNLGNFTNEIKDITITASGGPFINQDFIKLKNVSFKKAINHPKWKMGYKNSIDSATMVNKCLEIVETHYLFNIPYNQINVLIHPEAIVHSIVRKKNNISSMNLFKNDMNIPIINFLKHSIKNQKTDTNVYDLNSFKKLTFQKIQKKTYPIYYYFNRLDKSLPENIIKFNIGNEFGVNLFKNNLIKYTDIYKIIRNVCSLNLNYPLNNIKDIINCHEEIEKVIKNKYIY